MDVGELADITITKPKASIIRTIINKTKSIGCFEIFLLVFCTTILSPYIIAKPITHSKSVVRLKIITTLFSFHPDNSK